MWKTISGVDPGFPKGGGGGGGGGRVLTVMCGHMAMARGKGARRNTEAFAMCVLTFEAKFYFCGIFLTCVFGELDNHLIVSGLYNYLPLFMIDSCSGVFAC